MGFIHGNIGIDVVQKLDVHHCLELGLHLKKHLFSIHGNVVPSATQDMMKVVIVR